MTSYFIIIMGVRRDNTHFRLSVSSLPQSSCWILFASDGMKCHSVCHIQFNFIFHAIVIATLSRISTGSVKWYSFAHIENASAQHITQRLYATSESECIWMATQYHNIQLCIKAIEQHPHEKRARDDEEEIVMENDEIKFRCRRDLL